jgi:hypothetical protein
VRVVNHSHFVLTWTGKESERGRAEQSPVHIDPRAGLVREQDDGSLAAGVESLLYVSFDGVGTGSQLRSHERSF